jgi:hypothetical protein
MERAIRQRQRSIGNTRVANRTEAQKSQLQQIRSFRSEQDKYPAEYRGRLTGGEGNRGRQWAAWSKDGFEDDMQRYIWRVNRANGEIRDSSYGYRVAYEIYVKRNTVEDIGAYIDSHPT